MASVHRGSCLKTLNPFIDNKGLIHVGGWLDNASIDYCAKHPLILSAKSVVTSLIFNYEHRRLMHLGLQVLHSHISSVYWVIRGRIIARKVVNNCVQCFRSTPKFMSPLMAPLPRERVNIERPFAKTGLDFCGPILIRSGMRKITPTKSYICVFGDTCDSFGAGFLFIYRRFSCHVISFYVSKEPMLYFI